MKPGGGKQKGGAFERLVCVQLSKWLSRNMRDDYFWRSAMSGGRATVRVKRGQRNQTQEGDISAIDPQGHRLTDHFVVECKFVKDLHIMRLLEMDAMGGIPEYWETIRAIAARNRKMPMLIAKQNNGQTWIVLDPDGVSKFVLTMYVVGDFRNHQAHFIPFATFLTHARRP